MISSIYSNMNNSPQRKIQGKVELYNGSTRLNTFLATDKLQEITVSRTSEKGKFFGFGICQQATVKIVDKLGELTFSKGQKLRTSFRANDTGAYEVVCPSFYIKEVKHDEKANTFTLTSYDALDASTARVWADLGIMPPYTLSDVVERITSLLGLSGHSVPPGFTLNYENGANFAENDTTNLRTVLNAIAEVTQTIYYVDSYDRLVFKRLSNTSDPVLTISKQDYFELTTALPITLTKIMSVTELGNNEHAGDENGACQYIRDNPFWNTRTDLATLLPVALARVNGLVIVPYNIKWRGNFLTEICDKVSIQTKDNSYISTYILDDSFTYNGGFNQTGSWEYNPDSEKTTASNPVTIGEKLNQTFARVDKIEKNITLYVGDIVNEVLPTKIEDAIETITTDLNKAIEDVEKALGEEIDDVETNLGKEIDDLNTAFGKDISDLKATTSTHTENISQLTLTSTAINNEVSSLKETTTTITDNLGEVVAEQTSIKEDVGNLQIQSSNITASVSSVEKLITSLDTEIDNVSDQANSRIDTLSSDVALKLDKKGVEITVDQKLESGVDKVVTASKKYTFDDRGLNISATDSEFSTEVTENGMRIYKHSSEVLTVDNQGVQAADLHARTFLIIGENSRLEDRGNRTACFWIGPAGG